MIDTQVFAEHRRLLFDVAYRMTGSVADAEDLVQEAWLRCREVDAGQVANPRAYLVKTITNLSLNQLTSARARRETYVGPWLPEPVLTTPDAGQEVEMAESISVAMLVVLETLSPGERAIFLLHDVFGYSHAEIAAILDKSEPAVRQTATRARAHVAARRPRFDVDQGVRDQAVDRFRQACVGGDLNAMMELLAPDVVCWSDGGGKVTAARRPLLGADGVARWLLGVFAKPESQGAELELVQINGELGILGTVAGQPVGAVCFDFADGRITGVRMQVNPDKLRGLSR
ncbi:RNA polymerase sigma-70 factor (ECF subfamily) [Hamadaea flava]|uniref:RNA polymerase sigma-70 factor n=1 Tax=Hamadaea flava TaxID=1742688 RepID=A0ABV8LW69_9ACTN|nr:RNA polymerase sigma-70 factor [Hamadaea flava]MCP2327480.1 RNA polymerase sigma-70 factor (ECF subfamily) [Hamadaea flava]